MGCSTGVDSDIPLENFFACGKVVDVGVKITVDSTLKMETRQPTKHLDGSFKELLDSSNALESIYQNSGLVVAASPRWIVEVDVPSARSSTQCVLDVRGFLFLGPDMASLKVRGKVETVLGNGPTVVADSVVETFQPLVQIVPTNSDVVAGFPGERFNVAVI